MSLYGTHLHRRLNGHIPAERVVYECFGCGTELELPDHAETPRCVTCGEPMESFDGFPDPDQEETRRL